MHLSIVDDYPSGAAFGSDYFTRAARGEVIEEGPDGPILRPEKVVLTDQNLDYEGSICVGERTIRHLAHAFGMIDGWRVARLTDDNHALRKELIELSTELAVTREQLRFARELEAKPIEKVYLALDGTEHASMRAAAEATALAIGVESTVVLQAVAIPLSEPAPEVSRT